MSKLEVRNYCTTQGLRNMAAMLCQLSERIVNGAMPPMPDRRTHDHKRLFPATGQGRPGGAIR